MKRLLVVLLIVFCLPLVASLQEEERDPQETERIIEELSKEAKMLKERLAEIERKLFELKVVKEQEPIPEKFKVFLKEHDPKALKVISKLFQEGKKEELVRIIPELKQRYLVFQNLKEHDPEAFERITKIEKMEAECFELAEKIRNTDNEDKKEELKKELMQLLGKLFDLKEEGREKEVKALEDRLNHLKQQLSKRQSKKDEIIEKRLKQLVGEEDELGW